MLVCEKVMCPEAILAGNQAAAVPSEELFTPSAGLGLELLWSGFTGSGDEHAEAHCRPWWAAESLAFDDIFSCIRLRMCKALLLIGETGLALHDANTTRFREFPPAGALTIPA
jgi:hypothetical protein